MSSNAPAVWFQVFKLGKRAAPGHWSWRLMSREGRVLATCPREFETRLGAVRAMMRLKALPWAEATIDG